MTPTVPTTMNAVEEQVKRFLFVCVENSNRSQMAEAFARMHGGENLEAHSAGSRPSGKINPNAIVATMGCGDECPFVRAKRREEWDIPNPQLMDTDEFRIVRDTIETKVKATL